MGESDSKVGRTALEMLIGKHLVCNIPENPRKGQIYEIVGARTILKGGESIQRFEVRFIGESKSVSYPLNGLDREAYPEEVKAAKAQTTLCAHRLGLDEEHGE